MSRKLSVGDKVVCRYFNTPDNRFYGSEFMGEVTETTGENYTPKRDYVVKRFDDNRLVTVLRKEILRIIR